MVAGLIVAALSRDLPVGTLASPGPGMLPLLAIGLIVLLGLVLMLRGGESPALAEITWPDLPHALRVLLAAAGAAALYEPAGFRLTMALLLFSLLALAERVAPWRAAVFAVSVALITHALFTRLLKSPLPIGLLGF